MGHLHGVVEFVAALQDAGGGELVVRNAAQVPALLEPGEVPDLPQRRVDDAELGSDHLPVREVAYKLQGPLPAVDQHLREIPDLFP
ncbi:hypothetical protein GBA63_13760 [Rubrobacter tropicus]|uniref:Uncharacterized protein n=1 Tax=Rubrobacter tropicus TaxID=2653851 RepID=A0A6G8QAX6_9ACTN|nr:hypothetical protein [Rubrobacter tropicus]QIN83583.1 hypothetical protein GBA63_13760 [Rubrobacter tropicus]